MSTDIRALMRSLAEDAPALDNRGALADSAFSAGRRRRRLRQVEISGAATVVVLFALFATLFVGSKPLAAEYGTSGGTRVSGHPSHIGPQWPVLDLPAKPGPIAALISTTNGREAVSATGHRWKTPGVNDFVPSLSADGRLLGYLKTDTGPYIIHDLVAGTFTSFPTISGPVGGGQGQTYWTGEQMPLYFSLDDRYLAWAGWAHGTEAVDVLDVTSGTVVSTAGNDRVAGWSDGRLIVLADNVIESRSVTGGPESGVPLRPKVTLPQGDAFGLQVSTTRPELGYLVGGDVPETLYRFDLRTGAQIGDGVGVPAKFGISPWAFGSAATYAHDGGSDGKCTLVTIAPNGSSSTATTVRLSIDEYGPILAADAFDGRAHDALLLDRVSGWLIGWWLWLAWTAGSLAVIALVAWRARGSRQRRNRKYPQFASAPWSRRRKVVATSCLMTAVVAILALLTPNVFLASAAHLTSTQAPLLWSPHDQAVTTLAGVEGYPALTVAGRRDTEQGFVVLVENHSGHAIHVLGSANGEVSTADVGVAVATTAGDAAHARSLIYRRTGTIPAHQARWIRSLGTHCVPQNAPPTPGFPAAPESYDGVGGLDLLVRVGWISRTESVSFSPSIKWVPTSAC